MHAYACMYIRDRGRPIEINIDFCMRAMRPRSVDAPHVPKTISIYTILYYTECPLYDTFEHGRPRVERVCAFCRDVYGVRSVDDEYHLGCECPQLDAPRRVWWVKLLRLGAFPPATEGDTTGCPWGGSLFWLFLGGLLSSSPAAALATAHFLRVAIYIRAVCVSDQPSPMPWGVGSGKLRAKDCARARWWAAHAPTPVSFPFVDQPAHALLRRGRRGVVRLAPIESI